MSGLNDPLESFRIRRSLKRDQVKSNNTSILPPISTSQLDDVKVVESQSDNCFVSSLPELSMKSPSSASLSHQHSLKSPTKLGRNESMIGLISPKRGSIQKKEIATVFEDITKQVGEKNLFYQKNLLKLSHKVNRVLQETSPTKQSQSARTKTDRHLFNLNPRESVFNSPKLHISTSLLGSAASFQLNESRNRKAYSIDNLQSPRSILKKAQPKQSTSLNELSAAYEREGLFIKTRVDSDKAVLVKKVRFSV